MIHQLFQTRSWVDLPRTLYFYLTKLMRSHIPEWNHMLETFYEGGG